MSCHSIGHGVNSIVEHILELYWKKELALSTAKSLIAVARESINFCDGNTYEALECMQDRTPMICTRCLTAGKDVVNVYRLPEGMVSSQDESRLRKLAYENDLLGACICPKCMKELLQTGV